VIPESLKGLPAPAPASSLDPPDVPEETSRPLVVRRIEPLYPAQAIQQRLDGPVVLQVRVAKDGTVRDLKLVRGYFLLGRAAYDAVKQWRFKPYAPNGKPIEFLTNVTIVFKFPT
jgi:protein TonB